MTIEDMYVTDSYLFLVEYNMDDTNLWRIPFRRSGKNETLRWEDRVKICNLENVDKKDSLSIDWEDFLYAEDNKVIFSSENDGIYGYDMKSEKTEQIVSVAAIESLLSGKRSGFQKDIIETWNVYQFFVLKGRIYAILNAKQLTYSSRDDENYVYEDECDEDYKTYDYKLSVVSFRASDGNDLRYETQMNTFLQEKLAKTYKCADYDRLNYWTVDTGTPLCPVGKGQWIIEFPTQPREDGKRYKSDYYLYDVLTGNSAKIESREGQQMKEYKVRFKSYNGFC